MLRRATQYPGLYIDGSIGGTEVAFTVDTGATHTILSSRVYDKIPELQRPKLAPGGPCPSAADGRRLDHRGSATFELCLGKLCLRKRVAVADIADDVLLGADVLVCGPQGPADLILSEGLIQLQGVSIPVRQVSATPGTLRVRAADHYVVPSMAEMVLDAYVEAPSPQVLRTCSRLVVEPAPTLVRDYRLAMAPTLVDAASNCTVKVRVMNPTYDPVSVKQDTLLGHAGDIVRVEETVLQQEDNGEADNYSCIRRIMPQADTLMEEMTVRRASHLPHLDRTSTTDPFPPHLKETLLRASEGRSAKEAEEISDLLRQHEGVFSRHDLDLGLTNLIEHAIDTGDAAPIKQRPRRVPLAFVGEDQAAIEKLVAQGSVRLSTSPWASPLVLVRKRDGTVRPCVDYRAVNAVTKKDAFPLPRTEDCLDAVAGATIFSTMDITSAYNQIPVRPEDIPKTAFTSKHGLFEYRTMAFGLTNAPATFQRLMEVALAGLQWATCLIYLDDVIVFGRNFDEHKRRLSEVLTHIKKAGLKLKPSKCHLFRPEVTFLGHVVSGEGIRPDPNNVDKILGWPVPKTVTDVRAFLGMGNYYRRFLQGFSQLVKPLVELTKRDHPFQWTHECQAAFEELKARLTGTEVMAYPQAECAFILDTDASEHSIGAVLSQVQEGRERVVAYGSRTLNRAERNYCVTDRELLAVKVFVEYYKHYLLGRHFTVRSDHQALRWLFTLREPKDRVARWIEILSAYDFSVEYRPGIRHGNADALSRCVDPRACICMGVSDVPPCGPCSKCEKRASTGEGTTRKGESDVRRVTTRAGARKQSGSAVTQGPVPGQNTPIGHEGIPSATEATPPHPVDQGDPEPGQSRGSAGMDTPDSSNTAPAEVPRLPPPETVLEQHGRPPGLMGRHTEWGSIHSAAELRRKQAADNDISPVLKWLAQEKPPTSHEVASSSPATRHYWVQKAILQTRDGVLYRSFLRKNGTWQSWQFVVPRSMRREVMAWNHECPTAGHLGQKRTRACLLRGFYWHGVREDVNNWVLQCHTCGQVKPPAHPQGNAVGQMPVGGPLDRLATDVLGPLPETKRGNRYILVVTDHFTRWVEIFPIPDQTAPTCTI